MSAAGRDPAAKHALRACQACLSLFWKVESNDKCQYTHAATWKWAVAVWSTNRSSRPQDAGARWHLGAGRRGWLGGGFISWDKWPGSPGCHLAPLGVPSRTHYPVCFSTPIKHTASSRLNGLGLFGGVLAKSATERCRGEGRSFVREKLPQTRQEGFLFLVRDDISFTVSSGLSGKWDVTCIHFPHCWKLDFRKVFGGCQGTSLTFCSLWGGGLGRNTFTTLQSYICSC